MRPFMIDRQMKNEKGFTLIEMLIAMAMGIVLLGAAVYTYSKQDKVLREENRSLKTRDYARLAMDRLVDNLLLAGYGMPPGDSTLVTPRPARGFTNADVTTLTYRANTEGISTNSSFDRAFNVAGFLVPGGTEAAFTVGDQVVFFNVEEPEDWNDTKTLSTVAAVVIGATTYGFLSWSGNNGIAYNPIADDVAVVLNQYHTIIITYDAGAQTITITDDQGTGTNITTTVASRVSDLTFSYFDMNGNPLTVLTTGDPTNAAALGNIRKIGISITTVNEDDPSITTLLLTDITLRNMGI